VVTNKQPGAHWDAGRGLCSKERKTMTKLFQIALPRRDGFCRLEAENLNWQTGIHGPDADPLPHSR